MSEAGTSRADHPPVGATPITVRFPPDLLASLDRYAVDATGSPSRPELVRRIVRDWLITNGYFHADPIDALSDPTEQLTE